MSKIERAKEAIAQALASGGKVIAELAAATGREIGASPEFRLALADMFAGSSLRINAQGIITLATNGDNPGEVNRAIAKRINSILSAAQDGESPPKKRLAEIIRLALDARALTAGIPEAGSLSGMLDDLQAAAEPLAKRGMTHDAGIWEVAEMSIANAVLREAIDGLGLLVSVENGGDTPELDYTQDREELLGAMFAADHDVLRFRNQLGQSCGWILLIGGNRADLISDYTANATMERLVNSAEWLIRFWED